ncbi:uncharacterized protein DS421_11g347270 [Arachis hypogaea]|nr:uncharacterized protein DS421_11g347270 [Arachis hypogaea]
MRSPQRTGRARLTASFAVPASLFATDEGIDEAVLSYVHHSVLYLSAINEDIESMIEMAKNLLVIHGFDSYIS